MISGSNYELRLRIAARGRRSPTHAEWIEDEGCRRTYYAVYIFFGLLTLTYNHGPALNYDEIADLPLPSSESLWTVPRTDLTSSSPPPAKAHAPAPAPAPPPVPDADNGSADGEAADDNDNGDGDGDGDGEDEDLDPDPAWREALAGAMISTMRAAHDALFQGEAVRYSALATRVMITALFLEVWSHARRSAPLQDVVTEYRLRLALETWEKSLELCAPETVFVPTATGAQHRGAHPLIFNALAVYRNARARLEVDLKGVQEALRYHDPYEVAAAMTKARDGVRRSQEMVRVVEECFDCIEGVALAQGNHMNGANGAGKAPTNWSVEHPLCGCDLLVILSLWLYRLEHDEEEATEEELGVYHRIRNLLDDDAVDAGAAKLSATVARLWGNMLEEVVVWGYVFFHFLIPPLAVARRLCFASCRIWPEADGPRTPLWTQWAKGLTFHVQDH